LYLQIARTKTFIRKRRRSIIDIGYGSYFNSFTGEKLQDKGNKPKRACPPTDEEINILYNRNVLGSHTPQSLLNTLMSYMVK
jgi:hypothetical protein